VKTLKQKDFAVKAISMAVLMSLNYSAFALPKGDDFPNKLSLNQYIAKSIASDDDLEKMAFKLLNSSSLQTPFTTTFAQKQQLIKEQQTRRLSSGDLVGYLTLSDQSLKASQSYKAALSAADEIDPASLERILGAKPAFDKWFPSYLMRYVAATYLGGRVMPTWPTGTNPLYGSLSGIDERGEVFWHLSDKSPLYSEFKERKEKAFWGRQSYANFPDLPAKVFDSDVDRARVFMVNTVTALFYSQMVAGYFTGTKTNLLEGIGKYDSLTKTSSQKIPPESTYQSEWAHSVIYKLGDPQLVGLYKSNAAVLESTFSKMYFIPLSKAGEPVKFAFKPLKDKLRWGLVEFTPNGIEVRTIRTQEEIPALKDFPLFSDLATCYSTSWDPCLDYPFGKFNRNNVWGADRYVSMPATLKSKASLMVDALEEAAQQLPDTVSQRSKDAAIPLPKPGEKIDFWGSSNTQIP
jgi:hypothetical protein